MKQIKKILKTLFILTVIISSLHVYGNDLQYLAEFVNLNDSEDYTLDIATPVIAHSTTIADYERRRNNGETDSEGWLPGEGVNRDTTGTSRTFSSFNYVFHEIGKKFSTYNGGFVSSGTSNNIYYDRYSGFIGKDFDSIGDFSGVSANVPRNQGVTTSGYMTISKTDSRGYVSHVKWKVIGSVVIDVYRLSDEVVDMLIQRFGKDALDKDGSGIRFSNVLRTKDNRWPSSFLGQHKSYMDTAWIYFQATVGYWNSGGRGFQEDDIWNSYATGSYQQGSSVANEFDNILKVPFDTKVQVKRNIYIRHIKEDGTLLPQMINSSLNIVDKNGNLVGTRNRIDPQNEFQEYYAIQGDEGIDVRKSSTTKIGEYKYEFQRGEYGDSQWYNTAVNNLTYSKKTWPATSDPYRFRINTNKYDDVVVINMVYKEIPPPKQELPDLEMVGRLAFINTDAKYSGSTSGHTMDYIPSTKTLTPYAQGAYPYVVRALRYETKDETKSSSATVTANINYKWDIWTYSHGNNADNRELTCTKTVHSHSSGCYGTTPTGGSTLTCTITPHTHTDIWGSCYSHKHTSACDWYKTTDSSSKSRVFNYTVSYKHTWFQITNFRMYRISKLDVYDNNNDVGGRLFDGGDKTYTITPSSTYESRFNASRGRVLRTLTVTFPSQSYYLTDVYITLAKPSGGTSTATGAKETSQTAAATKAQEDIDAVTHKIAADKTSLTITYQYDNDYVELDSTTNMLQRNYRTWSERIDKETDATVRDLDATKTGSGSANTGSLSYTSNLMSFMRPSVNLTTNSDFTPSYQTIPADRENGVRQLSGRIYYDISTDSKYNVGAETFISTDGTYRLNNTLPLTKLDFEKYDKLYENNDVNKVNVFTPIDFGDFELITDEKVDHSTGAGDSTILQKNAVFTITPTTTGTTAAGYNLSDTREFIEGYYFIFDFNIIYNGATVNAYTPIKVLGKNVTLTAKTTDSFGQGSADQLTNSVKIIAITTNLTAKLRDYFDKDVKFATTKFMDQDHNIVRNTPTQNQSGYLTRNDIVGDAYHGIYKRIVTKNIGRIFDFAVTDCTDIAFKDIFRKEGNTYINDHSQMAYYSGSKYWNLYSAEYNEMLNRTDIGSSPQKILPLGPYKHLNTRYVNAPKMGYRISFDLKTTGYMNANNANNTRKIQVTPRYYYISKDGKTFDKNIKLYFKNASGNYTSFASSGYTIYYKPNDGYRYLRNSAYTNDHSSMSTKLEPLTVSTTIELTKESMSMNNTSFVQAWYGEYKLPNSTIAVSNATAPHNNINNPYTDGYIGVIFDVKCVDAGGFTLSYDTSDKSAGSQTNTSQWDYEGFMGFKTPGQATGIIRYQLEKDIWEIDNARYQDVKGTVVLFDLDNRAANDFE